jgi:hypothetical protein
MLFNIQKETEAGNSVTLFQKEKILFYFKIHENFKKL